ncbi:MAG: sigma-54 dependent transcriptional regulator [candidate division Zixibacteria bacterium]|nr:sigma-54 dependent transcriptional regulator [candidate division Zixibacteria bacterium]
MQPRILVIDDEDSMCNFMKIMLSKEGFEVDSASSGMEGISFLKQKNYDLVIADMNMPGMTGIEVLKEVKSFRTDQELIVMTAYASVETAIDAMKHGARDYITKPFKLDELKIVINKSLSQKNLEQENTSLKKRLKDDNSFDKFIGVSEQVVKLKSYAKQVALSDSTVLIRGESGTGKDLVAKAIHHNSPRSEGPLVTINCGALPENLLESELFGHKKGSFTGAIRDKEGLFKVADGGSLFLDEIGNVSIGMQVKLLRVLEDKLITPVGDTKPIKVDVRLIAATNADLEDDVKAGRFREDLFYRLNVIPIDIPSLRERKEDISLLVKHFIRLHCQKSNSIIKSISETALKLLSTYQWPGNVRELENTIERAVLLSQSDTLKPEDFPQKISDPVPMNVISESKPETPTLESIEKAYIHFVMSQTEGKKTKAAKILGIDASTLYRKIERYKLKDDFDKNQEKL